VQQRRSGELNAQARKLGILARLHLAFWTLYFLVFWGRAFRFDAAGDLVAGHPHLWADWAIHFTLGNWMAYRQLVPAGNPLLLGAPLGYPFAADLLSAVLIRCGLPMVSAFVLPSLLFSVLLVFALFYFLRTLFRSQAVAVVGSALFLCAGGLGFLAFFRDVAASGHPLSTLLDPPHEYTRLGGTPIVLLSVIEAIVVPQRSFTHGFPLAVIALGLIHTARDTEPRAPRARWIRLIGAGVILGVMPIVHAHTLLAVFVILCCWSVGHVLYGASGTRLQRMKPWAVVAATTAAVALPLIWRFLRGVGGDFVRWFPGWYARELHVSWTWFWLENWSLTPVLALAGLAVLLRRCETRRRKLETLFVFLPFFVLFVLLNLFLFAPWLFDNTKLLASASVGVSGLAAYALVSLWNGHGRGASAWLARPAAAVLLLASTASGAVDAYRTLRVERQGNVMYTAEALGLAEWARRHTAAGSVWLTGDQHNHWLTNLTGRQSVMAYRGWLWSQGYHYQETERDVARMLATADEALLARYGIDYVVIGPDERSSWHATERAFERYPVAARSGSYTVFRIR
jgi:hypothetical protein